MSINYLMRYWWRLLTNWLQGFADLPPGVRISSLGRPATYDRALAWKVLADDDSTQCIAFMFMNWSFLTWWYWKKLIPRYKFWRQQIYVYGNRISGSLWLKLLGMFFKQDDLRIRDVVFTHGNLLFRSGQPHHAMALWQLWLPIAPRHALFQEGGFLLGLNI